MTKIMNGFKYMLFFKKIDQCIIATVTLKNCSAGAKLLPVI